MKSLLVKAIVIIIIILFILSQFSAKTFGQTNRNSSEKIRAQLMEILRYADADKNAAQADVDKLVELVTKSSQDGLKFEERRSVFRDLFVQYVKIKGVDLSNNPQAFSGFANFAATNFQNGARTDLSLPEPRGAITDDYIHVETRGNGKIQMLLISDGGIDGRELYKTFVERNSKLYTMHIVTLPGAGLAKPQPYPEKMDFISRPWVRNMEQSMEKLVDSKFAAKKEKLVIIGTASGGYFAARLALTKPEKIRAVVLVDALVNVPTRSTSSPDMPATLEERLALLRRFVPIQLFPQSTVPNREEIMQILNDPKITHPIVANYMAFATKNEKLSKPWTTEALANDYYYRGLRYGFELRATDLTDDLKKLSVPMLAMCALHDDKSPGVTNYGITQWEEIKLLYPSIPLTVATFADTRAYISVERPKEFDRALNDFLTGKAVEGIEIGDLPLRPNPRAFVKQTVGKAEVSINYGRTALKGQSVQQLAPNNRVWRTGADEATTITFNKDVLIEGQKLPAGTYTLFTIPNEKEWTVIFNKITRQWGAFNYNPAFDALRVKVQLQQAENQEWLTFGFDMMDTNSSKVTLRWEKVSISFNVESIMN